MANYKLAIRFVVRHEAKRSAVKNGARDKEQGTREKEQFRTPLRYRFVANYEPEKLFVLTVVSPPIWFVVRHEAKRSAVKNGARDKEQGTREKEQFRTPLRYRFVANYKPKQQSSW
ncbi:MAG: hypothetical protein RMK18_12420 [Armatimonadota bacterium]|nr:hypothetical protein [Armatimonadota bacterium]